MTTLTIAAPPSVRPVPWHRLGWVSWRRHRATLTAVVAAYAAMAVYLWITGHDIRSAYATVQACKPSNSSTCAFLLSNLQEKYGSGGSIGVLLVVLPGLAGAFAGAPLVARELETGTFRYAWTQGAGRVRWAVATIAPAAVGLALLSAGLGLVVAWHDHPLIESGVMQRLDLQSFPLTGLAIAGWSLAGLSLGVVLGLLWRRVLPALASTFILWFVLAITTAKSLRMHYESPVTTTDPQFGMNDFPIDREWEKNGHVVSDAALNQVLSAIGIQQQGGGPRIHAVPGGGADPTQYLIQHGYELVTRYQPDSRYWTFQWIEFGWLTIVSVALLAAALWLVRRRAA